MYKRRFPDFRKPSFFYEMLLLLLNFSLSFLSIFLHNTSTVEKLRISDIAHNNPNQVQSSFPKYSPIGTKTNIAENKANCVK